MTTTATPATLTTAIFETFRKFINQRPGLDPRNYISGPGDRNGRQAYQQEARSIQKDGQRARAALKIAQAYPFNPEALIEATRAFSGRLKIEEDGSLDYCTGQYWPTEYRQAAATVLETYVEAIRPKTITGMIPRDMYELKNMNREAGFHFFDRDSMKFFRSRAIPTLYTGPGGVYFVTSEEGPSNHRRFTVRRYNPATADIDTMGEFNEIASQDDARARAKDYAKRATPPCSACLGSKQDKYNPEKPCWRCSRPE
jgi:hypothetical protein